MFCTHCGIDAGDDAFCKSCGTTIQKEQPGGDFNQQAFNQANFGGHGNQNQQSQNNFGGQNQFGGNQMPHPNAKSKIVAGLLGIFLGGLGIHNFYLGFIGKGVAQLLMSTIGWILIIPPFAAAIWALIEGIMILVGSINKDAQGIPLRE